MKDKDIFDEIRKANRDMDDILDEMIGFKRMSLRRKHYYNPPVDIYETDENFIINIELPGMEKEDISLTLSDDVLIIKGVRENGRSRSEEISYYHMEMNYGPFERRIRIPRNIDHDKMEVTYENGILIIELPLQIRVMKKIEIE